MSSYYVDVVFLFTEITETRASSFVSWSTGPAVLQTKRPPRSRSAVSVATPASVRV